MTLFAAVMINSFMIPFGIGFETTFATHPLIIFSVVVYLIDIPFRMRTGITNTQLISTESKVIMKDYLEKWLILDVISTFPFEYFLYFSGNEVTARWFMLLKLLKLGKIY